MNKDLQKKFTQTYLPPQGPNGVYIYDSDLHSMSFENNNNSSELLKHNRTIDNLAQERSLVTNRNIDKLGTPGNYNLTIDDSVDATLSQSNTRHLFKNLYGETLLTSLFFSKTNIVNIQNLIKMMVFKQMNKVVSDQSTNELMIVMRSIFLTYSEHPLLINENMSETQKNELYKQYSLEVARLNELVLNDIVPKICSELQQYLGYLHDSSNPRFIIDRSQNTSVTGQKQYRSITNVLTGDF